MKKTITIACVSLLFGACETPSKKITKNVLPTRYEFDRFYVAPVTEAGDTLLFYTDTGGGANMIYEPALKKLRLSAEILQLGDDSVNVISLPKFKAGASIPPPAPLPPFQQKLLVTDSRGHSGDGFLGRLWFAEKIWVFNYPEQTLAHIHELDWSSRYESHRIALGFQQDSSGTPTTYFPRITIRVEGDSIDLLFDTGAMNSLSDSAAAHLNIEAGSVVGTSFITASIFNKWQDKHPEWRVIEKADKTMGMPMIEVPKITIANHETGPVWFTMRPDKNFTEFMSKWMDKQIHGALGGSALKYFKVIVDYPNQIAEFEH